jgi:hypothetical protein
LLTVPPPIFINCRDRVTDLAQLVAWLERAGCEEIYLLDNDSAYEPLLAYYEQTPHTVLRLGQNLGRFAVWSAPGVFELTKGRPFVYTDPDIVPSDECPFDVFDRFSELLGRYPGVNKAGFGLRLDDLPEHYQHREAVRAWEGQHWRWPVEKGAYLTAIDTTFALYRSNGQPRPADAIRTGPPYVAKHGPWYQDLDDLSEEAAFYQTRGGEAHHWNTKELPEWLLGAVDWLEAQDPSLFSRKLLELKMYRHIHWRMRGRHLLPRR